MDFFEPTLTEVLQLCRARRSVRSFDSRALSDAHSQALSQFMQSVENPFGVPLRFQWLHYVISCRIAN